MSPERGKRPCGCVNYGTARDPWIVPCRSHSWQTWERARAEIRSLKSRAPKRKAGRA